MTCVDQVPVTLVNHDMIMYGSTTKVSVNPRSFLLFLVFVYIITKVSKTAIVCAPVQQHELITVIFCSFSYDLFEQIVKTCISFSMISVFRFICT